MTREEAIEILWRYDVNFEPHPPEEVMHAIDMAIEALQAEPTKAVPPSLADVYKWERDIALSQLEEYGIGFAEKKRDNLVEVVRCKDCRWQHTSRKSGRQICAHHNGLVYADDDNFCSYGERREPSK